jgi:hypothetical protein
MADTEGISGRTHRAKRSASWQDNTQVSPDRLLIVVAIIAILAIAVPNFLEAQVRAKVSRASRTCAPSPSPKKRTRWTGVRAYRDIGDNGVGTYAEGLRLDRRSHVARSHRCVLDCRDNPGWMLPLFGPAPGSRLQSEQRHAASPTGGLPAIRF